MYIHVTRIIPKKNKISEIEFNMTKQFIQLLEMYCDNDYTIHNDNELCDAPLSCKTKLLGFCERYESLSNIPKDMVIFRPFKNEKHANIIIELFEDLNYIEFDSLEINDYEKDGRLKYSGWLVKDGKIIDGSYIKTAPSLPILKMSILASLLMEPDEHKQYINNLMLFLRKGEYRNDTNKKNI